jgi:hypothetical protein
MATSSIFASFNIKDRKTAKAFAEALDQSAKEPKRVSSSSAPLHITDMKQILRLIAQRKKQMNNHSVNWRLINEKSLL